MRCYWKWQAESTSLLWTNKRPIKMPPTTGSPSVGLFWAAWRRSGDKSRRGCVGGRWSRLQLWSSQTWGCCAQQQCTAAEQSAANRRNNSYPIHTLYAPRCTLHPCFRFGPRRLSSPRRGENCSRARHRLQSWDYIGPRSFPIRGRDHRQETILYIS